MVATTAVGTSTLPTHERESNAAIARPASKIAFQQCDPATRMACWRRSASPRLRWRADSAASSDPEASREVAAHRCGQAGDRTEEVLKPGFHEVVGRGAQDEPGDLLTVTSPHQLGDRSAHRVAHDDRLVDLKAAEKLGSIIRTVLEGEQLIAADPVAMTPVIERDDSKSLGEAGIAGPPVQVGGRGPSVEEEEGRGASRTRDVPDRRRPSTV